AGVVREALDLGVEAFVVEPIEEVARAVQRRPPPGGLGLGGRHRRIAGRLGCRRGPRRLLPRLLDRLRPHYTPRRQTHDGQECDMPPELLQAETSEPEERAPVPSRLALMVHSSSKTKNVEVDRVSRSPFHICFPGLTLLQGPRSLGLALDDVEPPQLAIHASG